MSDEGTQWRKFDEATQEERDRCLREHTCRMHCLMVNANATWCNHCHWYVPR